MAKGDLLLQPSSLSKQRRQSKTKKMMKSMKRMKRTQKQHSEILNQLIQEQQNLNTLIGSLLDSSGSGSEDDYIELSPVFSDSMPEEDNDFGSSDDESEPTSSLVDNGFGSYDVVGHRAGLVYTLERIEERFIKMGIKVVKGYNANQGTHFKFQKLRSVASSTYDSHGVRYYSLFFEARDSDAAQIFRAEIGDYGCGEGHKEKELVRHWFVATLGFDLNVRHLVEEIEVKDQILNFQLDFRFLKLFSELNVNCAGGTDQDACLDSVRIDMEALLDVEEKSYQEWEAFPGDALQKLESLKSKITSLRGFVGWLTEVREILGLDSLEFEGFCEFEG
ncbi:OLC1v1033036C1 [Oldenlandia corymbosa var. corymbosa]|uniref:OLC1v1033036C1 n=1 Tax=Oldenlandia corymbosa var. corymbosa TaxID=529605 RepID=A0AAV1CNB5_OLDCO|nr:OLC1v1033036C1 [Oldenlandia corymbosa var. corymbosa]